MAEIVERVIYPLSGRTTLASAAFVDDGSGYDFAIGGLPFRTAPSDRWPMRRRTAPFRKDQFDNSRNPGEQTFANWWYRSQTSFHGGAGQLFLDIDVSTPTNEIRFKQSNGIDVWTQGELSLLPRTALLKSAGGTCLVMGSIGGGDDQVFVSNGVNLTRERLSGSTTVTWGGSGSILSMAHDGTKYYVADSTSIYTGPLDNSSGGSALWNTGSSNVVIGFAKQRLVAGIANKVYELVGGSPPTLPTALYTHPNTSWKWTGIAEGPNAIYVSGFAGSSSAILRFSLATTGVMPTLTSGVVAANLPEGEIVYSIYGYLGAFIGIGTNKGVRIGVITGEGEIQYGPLIVETTNPVRGFVGKDRFLFATEQAEIDGDGGLYRIDLSVEIEPLRFAYAADLTADSAALVSSATLFGSSGRLVFGIDGSGAHWQHATEKVLQGYLDTSNIRYGTVEPKFYKFFKVHGSVATGAISISSIDQAEPPAIISLVTIGEDTTTDEEFAIASPTASQSHLALRFTLNRDSGNANAGAILNYYQLKSLPAARKQRLLTIPLLCFETEKSATGKRFRSNPLDRLQDLEELDNSNDLYLAQDLCTGWNAQVYIEDVEYQQIAPPTRACEGFGGIINLTIRTT